MADPVLVGFGQVKFVKDTDTKMIWLVANGVAQFQEQTGTGKSNYTVPVGKKFIALHFYSTANTAQQSAVFIDGTTLIWESFDQQGGVSFPCYWEIPAGSYFDQQYNGSECNILGVECNA